MQRVFWRSVWLSMLLYVPEGAWKVSADSLQTYDGLMYRISNTTASVLGLEDTSKKW